MMPLLKDDKKKLAQEYLQCILSAVNVAVVSHNALTVNDLNALRMDIEEKQGKLEFVKKRVLLKGVNDPALTEDMLKGSIALLYSYNVDDAFAPIKVLQQHIKQWKKAKLPYEITYVAGYFDGSWKDGAYTTAIADLPSKEELITKLLFLIKYPVSSFSRVVHAIAEKKAE